MVSGVLARSAGGAVALLDAPLPTGFSPLVGATVQLVGSLEGPTTTGADGALGLTAHESRPRLLVTAADGQVSLVEAPGFDASAGPVVGLQHFPHRLNLSQGEPVVVRAVGVDAAGRYVRLDDVNQGLSEVTRDPEIPLTSTLAEPALLAQSAGADSATGNKQVQTTFQGLAHSSDASTYSDACQGSLSGRVLSGGQPVVGAIVNVEGHSGCAKTGPDGRYRLEHIAPVPANIHVFHNKQQIALGYAPFVSQFMTSLDIPVRPSTYTAGAMITGVTGVTGVAARPNRNVLVTDGDSLREFGPLGGSLTAPQPDPAHALQAPLGVAADFVGVAYVADSEQNEIVVAGQPTVGLDLPSAQAVALDRAANVFALTQGGTGFVFMANSTTTSWKGGVTLAGGLLDQPTGIAVAGDGKVYIADAGNDRIAVLEVTQKGRLLHGDPSLGDLADLRARVVAHWAVTDPLGVAVGPNDEVYVSTAGGVVCTDSLGHDPITVSSSAATGPIAVDPLGHVWVAESDGVQAYLPATVDVIASDAPDPTGTSLIQGSDLTTMDAAILAAMEEFGLPGATLAISVNGRLVLLRGYGYAQFDTSAQTPVQPDMRFRLASCSKSFTAAAALLQLQDYASDLALENKPFVAGGLLAGGVSGYDLSADGFKDSRILDISVAELLRMTAGLDSAGALYSPLARTLGGSTPPATAIETLLYTFSHADLANNPGHTFVYSDVAYMSLGRLIEAVAHQQGLDQTYAEYVESRLLTPLGITDMQLANTDLGGIAANEVHYYPYSALSCGQSVFTNSPKQVPQVYGATYDGVSHDSTGGWIASVSDLVILANSLAPNGPIPGFNNPLDATRQAIFSALPNFPGVKAGSYFGCGWFMSMDSSGKVTSMTKDGGLPGTMTYVQYLTQGQDQVVFAYLTNSQPGPGGKRKSVGRSTFQAPIVTFIAAQAGKWPATGNLFDTP